MSDLVDQRNNDTHGQDTYLQTLEDTAQIWTPSTVDAQTQTLVSTTTDETPTVATKPEFKDFCMDLVKKRDDKWWCPCGDAGNAGGQGLRSPFDVHRHMFGNKKPCGVVKGMYDAWTAPVEAASPSDLASMVSVLRSMLWSQEASIKALREDVKALQQTKAPPPTTVNNTTNVNVTNNITIVAEPMFIEIIDVYDGSVKVGISSREDVKMDKGSYLQMLTNGDAGVVQYIAHKWLKVPNAPISYRKQKGAHSIEVVFQAPDGSRSWRKQDKDTVVPPLIEHALDGLLNTDMGGVPPDHPARDKFNEYVAKEWKYEDDVKRNDAYNKVRKEVLYEIENHVSVS